MLLFHFHRLFSYIERLLSIVCSCLVGIRKDDVYLVGMQIRFCPNWNIRRNFVTVIFVLFLTIESP